MNQYPNQSRTIAGIACGAIMLLLACSKDPSAEVSTGNTQQVSVYLTDNPALFDKVLVDIRSIDIYVDTSEDHSSSGSDDDDRDDDDDNSGRGRGSDDDDDDNSGSGRGSDDDDGTWVNIPIVPGVYDLLQLRNGVDTLLGAAALPAGELEKIRIELGSNHQVVYQGVAYPLELPGGSRFVIKVDDDNLQRVQGRIKLHIDFDAGRSVIRTGNRFTLRPVLKSFCDDRMGRIEGRIAPKAAFPVVIRVYSDRDTALVIPDAKDGKFKIRGLPDGLYKAEIKPSNGFRDTILTGLDVRRSRDLKLAVIQLQP